MLRYQHLHSKIWVWLHIPVISGLRGRDGRAFWGQWSVSLDNQQALESVRDAASPGKEKNWRSGPYGPPYVCTCVCVPPFVYTCVRVYPYVCMHKCICTSICMYMCICASICICMYICAYVYTFVYVSQYVHTWVYVSPYMHMCPYHIYTHIYRTYTKNK